jgi:hypothetical protein
LPLKPDGLIVLFGCFTQYGPFYDWALAMAREAGPRAEVCAFEDDCKYYTWPTVVGDKTVLETDWYAKGNESLKKIHDMFGLEEEE